jgi:predicted enzyme related to lactoylglutathione lyase
MRIHSTIKHFAVAGVLTVAFALSAGAANAAECTSDSQSTDNCYRIKEILTRVFVPKADLQKTVAFYREYLGGKCTLHFDFPAIKLEIAEVASKHQNFLLIAGTEEAMKPFRAATLTAHVEGLQALIDYLLERGATALDAKTKVPTGTRIHIRHPDGMVVEYVEHNKGAAAHKDCDL